MRTERRTALLLADISGFTSFMRMHEVATQHAREIVAALLSGIIDAAGEELEVAEVEGDAVFFYAMAVDDSPEAVRAASERVRPRLAPILRAFRAAIERQLLRDCDCEACGCVANLRLKQIVHVGDVGIERIGRFDKLFGIEVIVAHRLLKNSVPLNEYVLLTAAAADTLEGCGSPAQASLLWSDWKESLT